MLINFIKTYQARLFTIKINFINNIFIIKHYKVFEKASKANNP